MFAIKLKGKVTPDRRLQVDLPDDIAPGAVEVIVLREAPPKRPKRKPKGKTSHPAFGIWAGRKGMADPAGFAAQLRRSVEDREDGRG